jgi:hypothetical protein
MVLSPPRVDSEAAIDARDEHGTCPLIVRGLWITVDRAVVVTSLEAFNNTFLWFKFERFKLPTVRSCGVHK